MPVCTSLQTVNHTSTPPLSFLQAGCPSCRLTSSVKALKAMLAVPTNFTYLFRFLELGGLQTLSQLLAQHLYDSEKLAVKAITLVSDLLTERVCSSADVVSLVKNSHMSVPEALDFHLDLGSGVGGVAQW